VSVENVMFAFASGIDYLVAFRHLKERGGLIATADTGDAGSKFARPGVAVHTAHYDFELGGKPLLTDDVDGAVIANLSGGQRGDHARAAGTEAEDDLFAEILGANGIWRCEKRLIDAHGGSGARGSRVLWQKV
jgi:hypothetical protein